MSAPFRIVALGDSMTESSGEGCPALRKRLDQTFPNTSFDVINRGVGGTRVGYGLWRLTHAYAYREQELSSVVSLNPDLILLESFAYNNGSDGRFDDCVEHFRDMHQQIVSTVQKMTHAQIVFVVTLAPDLDHFLEPIPNFIYTPTPILRRMAEDRIYYLEEAVRLAHDLHLPLANVYQASLDAEKNGTPRSTFILPEDGIHPGPEGNELAARIIVDTLVRHQIIEDKT